MCVGIDNGADLYPMSTAVNEPLQIKSFNNRFHDRFHGTTSDFRERIFKGVISWISLAARMSIKDGGA